MKPAFRTILVLSSVLLVAGVLFRQEKQMQEVRLKIAELTSFQNQGEALSTATTPRGDRKTPKDDSEIHKLRAEIAHLRQDIAEKNERYSRIERILKEEIFEDRGAGIGNVSPETVLKASALAESSPEQAAEWVATLPPGKEQEAAVLAVVDRWSGVNPSAAAAWATQFSEGPLRENALAVVARQWGLRDWNSTAGWLQTLPMGPSRDSAIDAFVTSADGYDIKLALEWANKMESPEGRAARVGQTARRWLRENNVAARSWIEQAQLPPGMTSSKREAWSSVSNAKYALIFQGA